MLKETYQIELKSVPADVLKFLLKEQNRIKRKTGCLKHMEPIIYDLLRSMAAAKENEPEPQADQAQ